MNERLRRSSGAIKRASKALLTLAICFMLPLTALKAAASEAEGEMPDPDRTGSITITFINPRTHKPVGSSNKISLYKVADVLVEDGYKFVYRDSFAEAGSAPAKDSELNADLAKKLAKIVQSGSIEPDEPEQSVDSEGKVSFSDLDIGLYLLIQSAKGSGTEEVTIAPFLVTIPISDEDGNLTYDVNATPKTTVEAEKPVKPTPPHLPQTGQLWWPVMALGAAGVLLLGIGMIKKYR